MSRRKRAPTARSSEPAEPARPTLAFSRTNATWLGAAAITIVAGYALLAAGSMTIAALLLVLGYCVLMPVGIIKK